MYTWGLKVAFINIFTIIAGTRTGRLVQMHKAAHLQMHYMFLLYFYFIYLFIYMLSFIIQAKIFLVITRCPKLCVDPRNTPSGILSERTTVYRTIRRDSQVGGTWFKPVFCSLNSDWQVEQVVVSYVVWWRQSPFLLGRSSSGISDKSFETSWLWNLPSECYT
jgi:hypothetical protein